MSYLNSPVRSPARYSGWITYQSVFRLIEGNHVASLVHLHEGNAPGALACDADLASDMTGRISNPRLGLRRYELLVELVLEILDPALVTL